MARLVEGRSRRAQERAGHLAPHLPAETEFDWRGTLDGNWLGYHREGDEERRRERLLLHHGGAHDGRREIGDEARAARRRRAPRAGRGHGRFRLCAAPQQARLLHGGFRAGRDEPHYGHCARLGRLHAGHRARRCRAGGDVASRRFPGHRPALDVQATTRSAFPS